MAGFHVQSRVDLAGCLRFFISSMNVSFFFLRETKLLYFPSLNAPMFLPNFLPHFTPFLYWDIVAIYSGMRNSYKEAYPPELFFFIDSRGRQRSTPPLSLSPRIATSPLTPFFFRTRFLLTRPPAPHSRSPDSGLKSARFPNSAPLTGAYLAPLCCVNPLPLSVIISRFDFSFLFSTNPMFFSRVTTFLLIG